MVEAAPKALGSSTAFTIKSLLVPLLTRPRVAQLIKWTVYLALLVNFGIYIYDDWWAYKNAVAPDAPWSEIFEQFSTTIDMAAWLGLVFLFELETYALPDEAFKTWVTRTIHAARIVCYLAVFYAAYGYTAIAFDYYDLTDLPELTHLCQVADQGTSLQLDTVRYSKVTSENCAHISAGAPFYRTGEDVSIIDAPTLAHVQWQSWVDVVNAYVWLIVVFLIEVEVRIQSADRFGSRSLKAVRQSKTAFYGVLIINGFIWAVSGYPMYAWDAFLWIFGFWAIELNLAEWEQERARELAFAE
ncbi:MAG: hypothetical protein ACE5KS_08195 [Woeseiaceae bacterium]